MDAPRLTRGRFVIGASALWAAAATPLRAGAAASYARTVLAKNPVAYWRLAERAGPAAADTTGHGHDGIYKGSPAFGDPGPVDDGPAVRLDGHRTYIEIADSPEFSQPASGRGLSVEAWLRPDVLAFPGQTAQNYVHWLGKGDADAFEWGFRFYSGDSPTRPNRISAYIWNASGGEGAGAYFQDELQAGTWIHVVACFDPGDRSDAAAGVRMYRDGVFRAGPQRSRGARYASYDIVPAHGAAPLRLGTRDLASFFTGATAQVAVYPRVLDASEIAENFRAARS